MQYLLLLLVAVLFLVALWRPAMTIVVIVVMFPLETLLQASFPFFDANSWAFNLAVLGLTVLTIVRRWLAKEPIGRMMLTAPAVLAWAFYVWCYLSATWSVKENALLGLTVSALPYHLLFLVLAPLLIHRLDEIDVLGRGVLYVGLVVTLLMVANPQFSMDAERFGVSFEGGGRSNPLQIGTLGGTVMLIAALTSLQRGSVPWIAFRAFAVVLGAGLTLLSGSRGQMLAAVLVIFALFPVSFQLKSLRGWAAAAAATVVVGIGMYVASSGFVSAENEERWSFESLTQGGFGRLDNVTDLMEAWSSRPERWMQGLGVNAFAELNTRSGDPYSHVLIADVFGEAGLIGGGIFLAMAWATWRSSRRLFDLVRDDPWKRIQFAVLASFICYQFLLANKQGSMLGSTLLFTFVVILGRLERQEAEERMLMEWEESLDEEDVSDEEMAGVEPMGGPGEGRLVGAS